MSVEQAENTDNAEQTEVQTQENVSHETNDNKKEQDDKSYAPRVDLSNLPEDIRTPIEARFTHLSRLMKKQELDAEREKREWRSLAEQQSKQIDDLMNGVGQVATYLHNQNTEATEEQLRKEARAAFEAGDLDKYQTAQDKLLDIKAQKAAQKIQPKQQPRQQTSTQKQAFAGYKSANELANEAVSDGDLTPQQAVIVSSWQDETDERGQPLRPWAKASTPNPVDDPEFIYANLLAKKIFESNPERTMEENLAELDKKMGVKKFNGKQNVMGGSLNSVPKQSRISLTPRQEQLAVKTKFGARDGAKTDSEYIAAYKKQLEKAKGAANGRR